MNSKLIVPAVLATLLMVSACSNTGPGSTGVSTASEADMASGAQLPPPPSMEQPDPGAMIAQ
jgi:hypothetical protein